MVCSEHIEWMFKSTVDQIKKNLSEQLEEANKLPGGKVKVY